MWHLTATGATPIPVLQALPHHLADGDGLDSAIGSRLDEKSVTTATGASVRAGDAARGAGPADAVGHRAEVPHHPRTVCPNSGKSVGMVSPHHRAAPHLPSTKTPHRRAPSTTIAPRVPCHILTISRTLGGGAGSCPRSSDLRRGPGWADHIAARMPLTHNTVSQYYYASSVAPSRGRLMAPPRVNAGRGTTATQFSSQ
ncbi:hypothetical protein [Streptomyces sp. NPDC001970]